MIRSVLMQGSQPGKKRDFLRGEMFSSLTRPLMGAPFYKKNLFWSLESFKEACTL